MNWVKIKQKLDKRDWHLWFAWKPVVVLTYPDGNEKIVWLKTVLRRLVLKGDRPNIMVSPYWAAEYKERPMGKIASFGKSESDKDEEWVVSEVLRKDVEELKSWDKETNPPMKLQEIPPFLGDDKPTEKPIMEDDRKTYLISAEKMVEMSERNQLWAHCAYCAKKVETWPDWKKKSFGEKYNLKGIKKEISPLNEATYNNEVSNARFNKTIM